MDGKGDRTLQHAISAMAGKPSPPRIVDGKAERSEPTKRESLDAVAQMLIKAGKLDPKNYDREISDFAAGLARERSFDNNEEASGSVFDKDAVIEALARAVLDRQRNG